MAFCGSGSMPVGTIGGGNVVSAADCTKIVQGSRTVSVPCTQNVCRTIKVPTTRQVTRYRTEPRSFTYQSTEIRTRPKMVKRPKQIMVPKMSSEQKTIMVPKQIMVPKVITVPKEIQVPKTIFVDVTTTEQYAAPVQKVGTRQVTVPYQVTVPAYRLANKCDQVTKIVKRQVPVFNVVAKQGPAPITGIRYLSGEAIIDQKLAAPILAQHANENQAAAMAMGTTTGIGAFGLPNDKHDTGFVGGTTGLQISNSADLNGDGIVTGNEAGAYSMGVRRVDAVTTGVGQVYTGTQGYTGGMTTGTSGLVIRNDTTDLNADGFTSANEANRFVAGQRRLDVVGDMGIQSSGLVVRNDTNDLNGDGVTTMDEAVRYATGERRVDINTEY